MNISENIGFVELLVLAGVALLVMRPGNFPDFAKALARKPGEMRRDQRHMEQQQALMTELHARLLRHLKIALLVSTAFTAAYLLVVGL